MMPRKRLAADDSSSDEDINMDKMIETKNELNKFRKEREAARAKLKKDFDKTLTNLRQRITQTAHTYVLQRGDINKAQVERLREAVAARGRIEQMIKQKLGELKSEFQSVSALLESGYDYRLEKASKSLANLFLTTFVSEQKKAEELNHQAKKVKFGSSPSS